MPIWYHVSIWLGRASMLLSGLLVWRLVQDRLFRRYPVLFAFLVFDLARTLYANSLNPRSNRYARFFMWTEPVSWVLYFLLVWEIYRIVLKGHPGLASAARKTLAVSAGIAIAVSAAMLWGDLARTPDIRGVLQAIFVLGRAVITAVFLLLLAGLVFMSWFPMAISRNASACLIGYSVYFFSKALLMFARNLFGNAYTAQAGALNTAIVAGCMAYWLLRLKAANEAVAEPLRPRSNPEDVERLMSQLRAIETSLERSTQRG